MSKVYESDCGNTTILAGDDVPDGFHLSEDAKQRVLSLIDNDSFLRVAVEGGGCAGFQEVLSLDSELEDTDFVIREGDRPLVAVDDVSMEVLKDSVLEFHKEVAGEYFSVRNPHAKSSCGCGKSFGF